MNASPAKAPTLTSFNFHNELLALLPRLRVQAVALTRNRADAEDLLHTAVASAIAHQDSFAPGTNFHAWLYRIVRNRFLSDRRARRETVDYDAVPSSTFARPGSQEDSFAVAELRKHLARLPADQREAVVMVGVEGLSYEQVAEATGCAIGTAKCRVFRARRQLEIWLLGEGESRRAMTKAQRESLKPATVPESHAA